MYFLLLSVWSLVFSICVVVVVVVVCFVFVVVLCFINLCVGFITMAYIITL